MTEWRRQAVQAALASLFILCAPLFLTLSNPQARLNGGAGGGWDWASGSFLMMGVMLFGAGMAIQFAARKITRARHRLLAGSAIGLVFLIAWVELAVDGVSKALATLT